MSITTTSNVYKEEELKYLHECLYYILAEFVRICDKLSLDYFLIGGSAIGAHFWQGIIPFDDDIDVGMTRENYDIFLQKAPQILKKGFFLQWIATEKHTPYHFAKLRLDNTRYVDDISQHISMHQGIFIDILPFDKIPNNKFLRSIQRKFTNIFNDFLVSKEVWRYRYFGKSDTVVLLSQGPINSLVNRIVKYIVPKKWIYAILRFCQTLFNNTSASYYNTLPYYSDMLPVVDAHHLQIIPFGSLKVKIMDHLEAYLNYHYPSLKKNLSEEEIARYSHRPIELTFDNNDME